MHIAILGRQPQLGMAELERLYGSDNTRWFSSHTATVKTNALDVTHLGGAVKVGRVSATLKTSSWRDVAREIERAYSGAWSDHEGKITLGISTYGFDVSPREVQKIGIIIKKNLKKNGVSLRLIPNAEVALNTATSHHNKLGLSPNKVELLIVRGKSGQTIVAESTGAQNITALAARDQARPKRDAFVGMLPPKLALLMINLAGGAGTEDGRWKMEDGRQAASRPARYAKSESSTLPPEARLTSRGEPLATSFPEDSAFPAGARQERKSLAPSVSSASGTAQGNLPMQTGLQSRSFGPAERGSEGKDGSEKMHASNHPRLLDPFCGTGVVLQEAALKGFAVYGTDLSEKMVRYTRDNLNWLQDSHSINFDKYLHEGDAMTTVWQQPIDLVVSETYLGQPFSAPPSPSKLEEVKGNVNHITTSFLKNLHPQLKAGTPLCLAVPAWRGSDGRTTHLPLLRNLEGLGYKQVELTNVQPSDLLYYREDQVVARQLLTLVRA